GEAELRLRTCGCHIPPPCCQIANVHTLNSPGVGRRCRLGGKQQGQGGERQREPMMTKVSVNTPPPERRWLQSTAESRIGPPFGGLRSHESRRLARAEPAILCIPSRLHQ